VTDHSIGSFLISLHRTSTLRHDPETQATVINLLLRSYIGEANLYDQADKLVARAPFPRGKAGNGQIARYEYYVGESAPARQASGAQLTSPHPGRIRAVQLNYSEAHAHLQQAIRRAPSTTPAAGQAPAASGAAKAGAASKAAPTAGSGAISSSTAPAAGFLQTAYKFLVVVELLMGDIPDRSIFRTEVLKRALAPYMEIVQGERLLARRAPQRD
jgi:26S proteasome regulatory subunit N3